MDQRSASNGGVIRMENIDGIEALPESNCSQDQISKKRKPQTLDNMGDQEDEEEPVALSRADTLLLDETKDETPAKRSKPNSSSVNSSGMESAQDRMGEGDGEAMTYRIIDADEDRRNPTDDPATEPSVKPKNGEMAAKTDLIFDQIGSLSEKFPNGDSTAWYYRLAAAADPLAEGGRIERELASLPGGDTAPKTRADNGKADKGVAKDKEEEARIMAMDIVTRFPVANLYDTFRRLFRARNMDAERRMIVHELSLEHEEVIEDDYQKTSEIAGSAAAESGASRFPLQKRQKTRLLLQSVLDKSPDGAVAEAEGNLRPSIQPSDSLQGDILWIQVEALRDRFPEKDPNVWYTRLEQAQDVMAETEKIIKEMETDQQPVTIHDESIDIEPAEEPHAAPDTPDLDIVMTLMDDIEDVKQTLTDVLEAIKRIRQMVPTVCFEMCFRRLMRCNDLEQEVQDIVAELSIPMTQSVETVRLDNNDDRPGPSNRNLERPASRGWSDVLSQEQRQAVDQIRQMFPDCDVLYVMEQIAEKQVKPEWLIDKMTHSYPKWKDRAAKEKRERRRQEFMDPERFNPGEFLKIFPDPEAYFSNTERPVGELYRHHAFTQLQNEFPNIDNTYLRNRLEEKNNHYLPAWRAVREDVAASPVIGHSRKKGKKAAADATNTKVPYLQHPRGERVPYPDEVDEQFYRELQYATYQERIKEFIEQRAEGRTRRVAEIRALNQLAECPCCYSDEVLPEEFIECSNSQTRHQYCQDCVHRHADEQIGQGRYRVTCLSDDCGQDIPLTTLRRILQPRLIDLILRRSQQEEVRNAGIDNMETCPFCDFAIIMDVDVENDRLFRCQNPDCLKQSCRLCKEENHVPLKCNEVEKPDEARMRIFVENRMAEALIRTCPKCNRRIVKDDGCNKIFCPCGVYLCYICRQELDKTNPYAHFQEQHGSKKNATCSLYSQLHEVNEKVAKEAGEKAREEYLARHPELRDAAKKTVDVKTLVDDAATAQDRRGRGMVMRMMNPFYNGAAGQHYPPMPPMPHFPPMDFAWAPGGIGDPLRGPPLRQVPLGARPPQPTAVPPGAIAANQAAALNITERAEAYRPAAVVRHEQEEREYLIRARERERQAAMHQYRLENLANRLLLNQMQPLANRPFARQMQPVGYGVIGQPPRTQEEAYDPLRRLRIATPAPFNDTGTIITIDPKNRVLIRRTMAAAEAKERKTNRRVTFSDSHTMVNSSDSDGDSSDSGDSVGPMMRMVTRSQVNKIQRGKIVPPIPVKKRMTARKSIHYPSNEVNTNANASTTAVETPAAADTVEKDTVPKTQERDEPGTSRIGQMNEHDVDDRLKMEMQLLRKAVRDINEKLIGIQRRAIQRGGAIGADLRDTMKARDAVYGRLMRAEDDALRGGMTREEIDSLDDGHPDSTLTNEDIQKSIEEAETMQREKAQRQTETKETQENVSVVERALMSINYHLHALANRNITEAQLRDMTDNIRETVLRPLEQLEAGNAMVAFAEAAFNDVERALTRRAATSTMVPLQEHVQELRNALQAVEGDSRRMLDKLRGMTRSVVFLSGAAAAVRTPPNRPNWKLTPMTVVDSAKPEVSQPGIVRLTNRRVTAVDPADEPGRSRNSPFTRATASFAALAKKEDKQWNPACNGATDGRTADRIMREIEVQYREQRRLVQEAERIVAQRNRVNRRIQELRAEYDLARMREADAALRPAARPGQRISVFPTTTRFRPGMAPVDVDPVVELRRQELRHRLGQLRVRLIATDKRFAKSAEVRMLEPPKRVLDQMRILRVQTERLFTQLLTDDNLTAARLDEIAGLVDHYENIFATEIETAEMKTKGGDEGESETEAAADFGMDVRRLNDITLESNESDESDVQVVYQTVQKKLEAEKPTDNVSTAVRPKGEPKSTFRKFYSTNNDHNQEKDSQGGPSHMRNDQSFFEWFGQEMSKYRDSDSEMEARIKQDDPVQIFGGAAGEDQPGTSAGTSKDDGKMISDMLMAMQSSMDDWIGTGPQQQLASAASSPAIMVSGAAGPYQPQPRVQTPQQPTIPSPQNFVQINVNVQPTANFGLHLQQRAPTAQRQQSQENGEKESEGEKDLMWW